MPDSYNIFIAGLVPEGSTTEEIENLIKDKIADLPGVTNATFNTLSEPSNLLPPPPAVEE